mmetsp:Transcript_32502/g.74267  ORF Transcript_32502/g.74267 Transcript_32502/m.74267 type:complete len:198 (+) Transcript_32502:62-655(+)
MAHGFSASVMVPLTPSRLFVLHMVVTIRCLVASNAVSSIEQDHACAGQSLLQHNQKLGKAESVPTLHYEDGRDNVTHWHLTVSAVRNGQSVNSSTQVVGEPEIDDSGLLMRVFGPLIMSKGYNVTYTVMQTFWHGSNDQQGYADPNASWNAPDPFAHRSWAWHFRWVFWSLQFTALLVVSYYIGKLYYHLLGSTDAK